MYLTGAGELICRHLEEREGHSMDPGFLHIQFEALEPPDGAIQVDVTPTPEAT